MNYPRFTKVIIDYFMTRKPSISRRNRIHWHYVRDDALFSTIKVVSRHQTTQQYGAILPIELTTAEIKNSKAYKEYHACVMGEAAPKPKATARKKKGDSASSTTPPTLTPTTTVESAPRLSATAKGKQPSRATTPVEPTDVQRTEAEQLKIVLNRSRQETHISQQSGSGTDEGTGSKPRVLDVPSDDSEEELSWKSSDDEDVGGHEEGNKSDESDDDRDEGKSEGESDDEETREEEEESFDSIPITPEESEEESNDEDKAYKEYYACAMGEAAPKPKASSKKKKGESASSTTPPTPTPTTTVESAPRLSATAKGKQPSRATTPIEPTDEELSWNSFDDENVGGHEEGNKSDESDYDRDEGSDDDSDETVKAGAGKDDDDN
nr:hypothetical protein [Tanacetum cinerariifolium]